MNPPWPKPDTAISAGRGVFGNEPTLHDLMDQLAAVRSELARSEADGVRARSIVADIDGARVEANRQSAAARLEAERATQQADVVQDALRQRIAELDGEIAALHATKTMRLARVPRRIYARTSRRFR